MSLASQGIASKTTGRGVPILVSPSVRKSLEEVGVLLDEYGYSPHCRGRILGYIAREGTATGCPELDAADLADVERVFESELSPVPFESEAWDRDRGVLFDAELLALGTHPWPIPATGDDDRAVPPAGLIPPELEDLDWPPAADIEDYEREAGGLPPVRGGGPADEDEEAAQVAAIGAWLESQLPRPAAVVAPYEPTSEDLEDYRRWCEEVDRREEIRALEGRCSPQYGWE